jgi:magnesium-transporting ATPase (P-type)
MTSVLPSPLAAPRVPGRPPAPGLSSVEAQERLGKFGPNVLAEAARPRWLARFARNFTYFFALLLWVGAGLAWLGEQPQLSVAIVAVIVVNAVFSFVQEYRAERAIEALRRILPQRASVRRDGRPREIDAQQVVPGDILLLAAGDRVAADGGLVADVELKLDMSTLTGESRPVRRHRTTGAESGEGVGAPNLVFGGTYVVAGTGEARVTVTGMRTELGRIAELTQRAKQRPSPLELEMGLVTRLVAILAVSIGVAFFLVAGLLGMSLDDRFVFAIGVIVALVPEGLLPTVTLSLALATQRMARRNAIVRRLSSVETLGATNVICTDKTGTLTANQMTVRRIWMPGVELAVDGVGYAPAGVVRTQQGTLDQSAVEELARAGALCNDASLEEREDGWHVIGDPTEGALLTLARKIGLDPAREAYRLPRRAEIPFDSARKRMTTVHDTPKGPTAYVKGAPGLLISRSTLDERGRAEALAAAETLARDSLRVLAIARRTGCEAGEVSTGEVEQRLELLGLVGMHDPPRPEVADAVRSCRKAGIRVIMVTGDYGITAEAVARRIGLIEGSARILEGAAIDNLDHAGLVAALLRPDVLVARVTPEQKLQIAEALHTSRQVVAMTGDGVNDAPALRAADIGVAMGRAGTDVAREASDIILTDDNFASIAAAVEEGRTVYDNIRRFAQYHFSSNVAELLAFLVWGLSGGAVPLPLVVMQVLAIDLGTDLLPAIALGAERPEPGVMSRPPRSRQERLLNRRTLGRVFGFVGLLVGLAGLASFLANYLLAGWWPGAALPATGDIYVQATAMTYGGIVMGQVGAGLAFRTNRDSVFRIGLLSNRFLLIGIAFELALLVALVYVPAFQGIFHTQAYDPRAWLLLIVWPVFVFGAEEARKAVVRWRMRR